MTRQGERTGCDWAVKGLGLSVSNGAFRDMWAKEPRDAAKAFGETRARLTHEGRDRVLWGDGNLDVRLSSDQVGARAVTGLGDEAFAYELVERAGDKVHRAYVLFRLSNAIVEVVYTDVSTARTSRQIKDGALRAAHWAATALKDGT